VEYNFLFALGLSLLAGLATGIGSMFAFFSNQTNTKFLSTALGFSAGVMIYISFVEIFPNAQIFLQNSLGESLGSWIAVASFFCGIGISAIIDWIIPSYENPHEGHFLESRGTEKGDRQYRKLQRIGIVTAIVIALHNFPEGIATFIAALQDETFGISVAVAVAIHNIPEGIAVSVPLYFATGNRKKAFLYSFLSGLAEPLGALVAMILLLSFFSDTLMGILFAWISGIMVFIALDELLPTAREYGEAHRAIYGMVAGMAVMAISLLLF
jgi:zinc transporter, ZIP family